MAAAPLYVTAFGFVFAGGRQHLHFQDEDGNTCRSTPVARIEDLGGGEYLVITRNGTRYRSRLEPDQLRPVRALVIPSLFSPPKPPSTSALGPAPLISGSHAGNGAGNPPSELLPTRGSGPPAAPKAPAAKSAPAGAPAVWHGAGSELRVGTWVIPAPLTYSSESEPAQPEASNIDRSLPVGNPRTAAGRYLPYGPRYDRLDAHQRARYLEWLAGGRCDPHIDIGYVYIYFSGLERRLAVEREDTPELLAELTRLKDIYRNHWGFSKQADNLASFAIAAQKLPAELEPWLPTVWHDNSYMGRSSAEEVWLAWHHQNRRPIPPADWYGMKKTLMIAQFPAFTEHVRRELASLFALRCSERFGEGIRLQPGTRRSEVAYRPVSPTLLLTNAFAKKLSASVPTLLDSGIQFDAIGNLWLKCVDDLKLPARLSARGISPKSIEYYEALPEDLRRTREHPAGVTVREWMASADTEDGIAFGKVADLARALAFDVGDRIPTSGSRSLVRILATAGYAIEPDAPAIRRTYGAEQRVAVFPSGAAGVGNGDDPAYLRASLALEYALALANSSVALTRDELERIAVAVQGHFAVPETHHRRWSAAMALGLSTPPVIPASVLPAPDLFPPAEGTRLMDLLVDGACHGRAASPPALKFLRALGRALKLDAAWLKARLDTVTPATGKRVAAAPQPPVPVKVELDPHAIRRIQAETREVAVLLTRAMGLDEQDGEPHGEHPATESQVHIAPPAEGAAPSSVVSAPPDGTAPDPRLAGLPSRFASFAAAVVARPHWPSDAFDKLARAHGHFPSGAVEAINAWAEQELGDLLLDLDDDGVRVDTELLPS